MNLSPIAGLLRVLDRASGGPGRVAPLVEDTVCRYYDPLGLTPDGLNDLIKSAGDDYHTLQSLPFLRRLIGESPGQGKVLAGRLSQEWRPPLTELFGDTPEVKTALRGLLEGWGIADFERELGRDQMVLLVRQQFRGTRELLGNQWHGCQLSEVSLFLEARYVYEKIRGSHSFDEVLQRGRYGHEHPFFVAGEPYFILPFVYLRELQPDSELLIDRGSYGSMLTIAKWPRVLSFDPEQFPVPFAHVAERWILGGVPERFIILQGNFRRAAVGARTVDHYYQEWMEATGPVVGGLLDAVADDEEFF